MYACLDRRRLEKSNPWGAVPRLACQDLRPHNHYYRGHEYNHNYDCGHHYRHCHHYYHYCHHDHYYYSHYYYYYYYYRPDNY